MRVLLRIFALATVAVAWAAASGDARPAARAALVRGPAATAGERVALEPDAPRPPEDRPAGESEDRESPTHENGIADIGIVPIEGASPVDAVPVDVVIVDGENGDVLRRSTTTVERGPERVVTFKVAASGGYVADFAGTREVKSYISRHADRVRVVEPVRREADIRVRVVDAAGHPVAGAEVSEVLRGGDAPPIVALSAEEAESELEPPEPEVPEEEVATRLSLSRAEPTGTDGWTRVRGVPHLLDERYWIVAGKGRSEAFTDVLLGVFGERHMAEIRLPVASRRGGETNSAIGLSGCGGSYCCRSGRRWTPATLDVVVLRRDGRMGVGLEVRAGANKGMTDGSGHVMFEGLRPGAYAIEVRDPDFVWSKAEVELRDGEWCAFAFSEAPGWTARAVLLDSVGRPVPFARVFLSSDAPVEYVCVEDGVQDLVFWTDANGEIRLPGMHHAPVRLRFSYGSRSESVKLEENDPLATIRLPPP